MESAGGVGRGTWESRGLTVASTRVAWLLAKTSGGATRGFLEVRLGEMHVALGRREVHVPRHALHHVHGMLARSHDVL